MSSPCCAPDEAVEHRPAEHLGVAHLVELRARHVEQRVGVAGLHLRHQPAVEVELGVQVLGRAGEVRHPAAGNDGHLLVGRPPRDDLGDRLAERLAAPRRRQRRHVDVGEERDHRDVALADHVLERNRERVAELGILRVGDVETVLGDQLVEDVLGHLAVDGQVVLAARELRDGAIAGDDGKRRHARHREGFDVVGAEEEDDVGLGLVEHLAELVHGPAGLLQLFRVFVRRPREHVGRVTGADGCDDLSHAVALLVRLRQGAANPPLSCNRLAPDRPPAAPGASRAGPV